MRVISGSCRGTKLNTPEGLNTRPTQDRIKETLFNMIGPDLYDSYFLDLFSGSGQMGIEALSRGAKKSVFIEQDKNAISCIRQNISKCKFDEVEATLYGSNVLTTLKTLNMDNPFDYIFMDPPYNMLLEKEVLEILSDKNYVDAYTCIIVEASLETELNYLKDLGFEITKEKIYKTNKHVFIKRTN